MKCSGLKLVPGLEVLQLPFWKGKNKTKQNLGLVLTSLAQISSSLHCCAGCQPTHSLIPPVGGWLPFSGTISRGCEVLWDERRYVKCEQCCWPSPNSRLHSHPQLPLEKLEHKVGRDYLGHHVQSPDVTGSPGTDVWSKRILLNSTESPYHWRRKWDQV